MMNHEERKAWIKGWLYGFLAGATGAFTLYKLLRK